MKKKQILYITLVSIICVLITSIAIFSGCGSGPSTPANSLNLTNTSDGNLSGRVVDVNGNPIAGAIVNFFNNTMNQTYAGKTDSNGNYTITTPGGIGVLSVPTYYPTPIDVVNDGNTEDVPRILFDIGTYTYSLTPLGKVSSSIPVAYTLTIDVSSTVFVVPGPEIKDFEIVKPENDPNFPFADVTSVSGPTGSGWTNSVTPTSTLITWRGDTVLDLSSPINMSLTFSKDESAYFAQKKPILLKVTGVTRSGDHGTIGYVVLSYKEPVN